MDPNRRRSIQKRRRAVLERQRGRQPDSPATLSQSPSLASAPSAQTVDATTRSAAPRGRDLEPGDFSTGALMGATMRPLQLARVAVLSRIRRLPGLDLRYARPLRHYLRQAIQERIEHDTLPPPGAIDPDDLRRYRWAYRQLLPPDEELIVARVELGYSYDQLALATDRSSARAARSALRRALLRLAEEMGRA